MSKTELDVCTRAARIMNYIASDEALDDDSYADAQAEYEALHEWLRDEVKIRWAKDSIEDAYYPMVAGILAGWLIGIFPVGDVNRIELNASKAEKRLRQRVARKSRRITQVALV